MTTSRFQRKHGDDNDLKTLKRFLVSLTRVVDHYIQEVSVFVDSQDRLHDPTSLVMLLCYQFLLLNQHSKSLLHLSWLPKLERVTDNIVDASSLLLCESSTSTISIIHSNSLLYIHFTNSSITENVRKYIYSQRFFL